MTFAQRSLRTSGVLLLLSALAPALVAAQEARGAKAGKRAVLEETVDVELINVDVVVTDKSGNLVTDLTREDFQVLDDGKKVNIGYFARLGGDAAAAGEAAAPAADGNVGGAPAGAETRHLAVFVDLDNLAPPSRTRVLGDVTSQLSKMKTEGGPGLRVMVATFGPRGLDVEQPFSESPAEWVAALQRVEEMPGRGAIRAAQRRRLVASVDRVLAMAEGKSSLQDARDQLDELMGSVRVEAESLRADARTMLMAMQTLATVLSTVSGEKSLLYVGDGVPMRPGQDLQDLLAEAFESDHRFSQAGGDAPVAGNPGSQQQPGSEGSTAGVPEQGLGGADPSDTVTPMSGSTSTLRIDGMSLDLAPELRALTATANSQRVTLYGLSTDAPGNSATAENVGTRTSANVMLGYDTARSQLYEQSLQFMAQETGGLALPPNAGVEGFLDRVVTDRDNRYSLAYAPPHGGDGKFHPIKVKVDRKGVRLRYREGYIDRPRAVRIGDQVAGALLLGSGENPHQVKMKLLTQEPAENDEYKVSFDIRIPIGALTLAPAGGNVEAKLELYLLSKDETGAMSPMRMVEVKVAIPSERMAAAATQFYAATLPIMLKKGPQTVAIGVVEPAAQRTSLLRTELQVGPAADG